MLLHACRPLREETTIQSWPLTSPTTTSPTTFPSPNTSSQAPQQQVRELRVFALAQREMYAHQRKLHLDRQFKAYVDPPSLPSNAPPMLLPPLHTLSSTAATADGGGGRTGGVGASFGTAVVVGNNALARKLFPAPEETYGRLYREPSLQQLRLFASYSRLGRQTTPGGGRDTRGGPANATGEA